MKLPFLDHNTPFPAPSLALDEPNGLLAVGGDLSPSRLIDAYSHGIFPWFSEAEPLLWWSPNPRAVMYPTQIHISKSMRKFLRKAPLTLSVNHAFDRVIAQCAKPRATDSDTWITSEMSDAYIALHQQGYAHSVEVWQNDVLVGGLYGVGIGAVFCGESMFHSATNCSKVAAIALCRHFSSYGGQLIDCQLPNTHLMSLGTTTIKRDTFLAKLHQLKHVQLESQCWVPQIINLNF